MALNLPTMNPKSEIQIYHIATAFRWLISLSRSFQALRPGKMGVLLVAIILLAQACSVCAHDKTFLYGEYYAGMSREDFFKTGPAQCDEFSDGKMVCNRKNIIFAAQEWTQFFEFTKNGLSCVGFGQHLSSAAISAAMAWLQDENYVPIEAETGQQNLSFLPLYEENGKSGFKKDVRQFNKHLPTSDRFKAYLVKNSILKEYKTADKLPANAILVSMGGEKSRNTFFVCFETVGFASEH